MATIRPTRTNSPVAPSTARMTDRPRRRLSERSFGSDQDALLLPEEGSALELGGLALGRSDLAAERGGQALDQGGLAPGWEDAEWNVAPLHPVAHWVLMPTSGGGSRLEMVWEVPDPMPPAITH